MTPEKFQRDILNVLSEIYPFSEENVINVFILNDKQIMITVDDGSTEKSYTLTIQRHFE